MVAGNAAERMYKYKCAEAKKAASTDPSAPADVNRYCEAVMSSVLSHFPEDT